MSLDYIELKDIKKEKMKTDFKKNVSGGYTQIKGNITEGYKKVAPQAKSVFNWLADRGENIIKKDESKEKKYRNLF